MSEHKTGKSNWTAKQKQDYRDRRNKDLRGQVGTAIVVETIRDDKGNITGVVPVSDKIGASGKLSLRSLRRADWREARAADRRENRRKIRNELSAYRPQDQSSSQGRGE